MRNLSKKEASIMGSKSTRKGVANKSTQELKNALKIILEGNINRLQSDIDSLTPKERIDVLLSMANYVIPKQKAVEISQDETELYQPIILNLGSGCIK